MPEGYVKRLVLDRGFGFIAESGEPDVFFHAKDVDDDLLFDESLQDRRVLFNLIDTEKGPAALNVRPIPC